MNCDFYICLPPRKKKKKKNGVPFNIPQDQNSVEIISKSFAGTLHLPNFRQLLRGWWGANLQNLAPQSRVRSGASSRVRIRDEEHPSTSTSSSTSFPELFNNLAWLAAGSQDIGSSSSQLTASFRNSISTKEDQLRIIIL
ncbi:hypothetical protein NQ318_022904 [Aromia moschata]|uniref:Uncharacterized protein n=1 Tax=Aromia moschata TaxID=1265417 RepID=A0AAV8XA97_9CUCU|nr:hypothetical protein NQ318_022904 [Aromia moschata]